MRIRVAIAVLLVLFTLSACTTGGVTRSSSREWFPDGGKKSETSSTNIRATHLSSDAPAQLSTLADSAGTLWDKFAAPVLGSVLATGGISGIVGVARRRAQKQDDEKWEKDAELRRAEEYQAGYAAGVAAGVRQKEEQ